MAQFVVTHQTALTPQQAWDRLTDWPRHARYVPLTSVTISTAQAHGVGAVWVARTSIGPLGFDDPMQVVIWRPPVDGAEGVCRLEKQGRVVLGWAQLTVTPHGAGSRATWREQISVAGVPRFTDPVTAAVSRRLFGRVLRRLLEE